MNAFVTIKNIPKPVVTREHGSWAVLLVPIVIGAAQAGSLSWNTLLFALSAVGAFLSYVPAQLLLREGTGSGGETTNNVSSKIWFSLYFGFSAACFIPLLIQQLWYLLIIAILAVGLFLFHFFVQRKTHNSVVGDIAAVAGLTLGAPGAYYAATGRMEIAALVLWLLNALFFGCSVSYVHSKITMRKMRKDVLTIREKCAVGKGNIVSLGVAFSVVVLLAAGRYISAAVVVAFLPMAIHSIIGTARPGSRVNFKRLGFLLLADSVLFASVFLWMV